MIVNWLSRKRRRGAIVAFLAILITAILAMCALVIDLGVVMIVHAQCQASADAIALAGCRQLNGDSTSNYNYSGGVAAMPLAAQANTVLGAPIDASMLPPGTNTIGEYYYDTGTNSFLPNVNGTQDGAWSLAQAQVNSKKIPQFFAPVFQLIGGGGPVNPFTTSGYAVAVHRPLDISVSMDLSGSMHNNTIIQAYDWDGPTPGKSGSKLPMGGSGNWPNVGHYAAGGVNYDYPTSGYTEDAQGQVFGACSLVMPLNSVPIDPVTNAPTDDLLINDYYNGSVHAFTKNTGGETGDGALWPNVPTLTLNLGGNSAFNKAWEGWDQTNPANGAAAPTVLKGYNPSTSAIATSAGYGSIQGYYQSVNYWGKTFWIWPPHPQGATKQVAIGTAGEIDNGALDWRQKFFYEFVADAKGLVNFAGYNNGAVQPGFPSSVAAGVPPAPPAYAYVPLMDNCVLFQQTPAKAPSGNSLEGFLRSPDQGSCASIIAPYTNTSNVSAPVYVGGVATPTKFTWRPNYRAILNWIINTGTNPFPPSMHAGGFSYYTQIPDPTDNTLNIRWWQQSYTTDYCSERWWKEYIDYVLGVYQRSYSAGKTDNWVTISHDNQSPQAYSHVFDDMIQWGCPGGNGTSGGYGGSANPPVYIAAGSSGNNGKPSSCCPNAWDTTLPNQKNKAGTGPARDNRYMNYDDNPARPVVQFWFGAMSMCALVGGAQYVEYGTPYSNLAPGTGHESPSWICKAGFRAAFSEMSLNHPNDFASLNYYSSLGQWMTPMQGLGRNFKRMTNCLFWPHTMVDAAGNPPTTDQPVFKQGAGSGNYNTPYISIIPRAGGCTDTGMGLVLAYNSFSSNSTLYGMTKGMADGQPTVPGQQGGGGRRGAQKVVIFETDGATHGQTPGDGTAAITGTGPYNDYYDLTNGAFKASGELYTSQADVGNPAQVTQLQIYAQNICTLDTMNPPGYSTTRRPALIHTIAFGSVFDSVNYNGGNAPTLRQEALTFLQNIQAVGGTQYDASRKQITSQVLNGWPVFPTNPPANGSTYAGQYSTVAGWPLTANKIIYGTPQTEITNLQAAFSSILQNGASISLIK
jgi:Flp pilus assembly protein TadG